MEKSKLDNLLKKIEENKNSKEEKATIPVELKDAGETLDMRLLTFHERKTVEFNIVNHANGMVNLGATFSNQFIKKIIYNCCGLSALAVEAKNKKLINSYYDVIDYLFTADDLSTVFMAILENNKMLPQSDIEEAKN